MVREVLLRASTIMGKSDSSKIWIGEQVDDKGGPYTIWGKPMEVHQNLVASLEDQYDHKGRKWHQDFILGG